ncbi:HTH_Tnp_Tc3_2 domain-containing protein [Trichonephila clavipes]|nr:HTH_Tnp_Tc3_2 domain-containing protein [Trichonephila clavipes]
MGQGDAAFRICWQEWVDNGRFQRHDGSDRPRATGDWENRLIWLIERNLPSYQPLRNLPLTPAHCPARLQSCLARSGWNHADCGRIAFSDESCFRLCSDNHRRHVWRRPGQRADPAFPFAHNTGSQPEVMIRGGISFDFRAPLVFIRGTLTYQRLSNTSLASQIARSLSSQACLGYDGKVTASTREC